MRQHNYSLIVGVLAVALTACTDSSGTRVLELNATGGVKGLAYIDRNGNGVLETNVDAPLQGIAVKVIPFGANTGDARAVTNVLGGFVFQQLNVGEYSVSVDNTTVPDSLRIAKIDSAKVRVAASDTPTVVITLSFPTLTARAIRQQPAGRRVFIEGVTLNSWSTYGDSTLHVADTSGVLRITRVAAVNITSGTRVRVLGTTDLRDGQRGLTDATAFSLASAPIPAATSVTTAVAAKADAGKLDAALVSISNATILGAVVTTAGDVVLNVSDGSGVLEVMIDRNTGISPSPYSPGATLSATGILVPSDKPGEWQLKPRAVSDLSANFPSVTIAEFRKLEIGKIVSIDAVALNGPATFGDLTVHLSDSTGSLRAVLVQNFSLFEGNRVRMLGAFGFRDGQPVLTNVSPTVLGTGVVPLPEVLTSAKATTADGGKFDAALVKTLAATVADTATIINEGFRLHVNDGSGLLEVLLDRDSGFQLTAFIPGAVLDVTGVLVPIPGGSWRLKPRKQADVIVVR